MLDVVRKLGIRGLNHLISSESWAQERLLRHAGAQVLVELGLIKWHFGIGSDGLFRESSADLIPDVTLSCPPDILIRALFDKERLFSTIKLGGSVDIAETLGFVFRNLRWDVEGDLAGLIGDIPARRLTLIGRSFADSLQRSLRNIGENIREYTTEESETLANKRDVSDFGEAVGRIRDDVARLEKRLAKL